ncbi:MAG: HAD family hydrolase [Clostridiaceae bacterium]
MINEIEAAIFDMDGTLIDSMGIWCKLDHAYLNKRNISIPKDLKKNIEHLSFINTAKYFKKTFNLSESVEDIVDEWNEMAFCEYANNIKLKENVDKYLKYLVKNNIKIGLATSNNPLLTEAVLKKNKIYDYFQCIATTDEVGKPKNCPDIYLLAAKRLNVDPSKCLVFEDILAGVMGAKKAGMKVIGVYDDYSLDDHIEMTKNADLFITEYKELLDAI